MGKTRDLFRASLVAQMVKHLPTMQETWARSLSQEDPLEKEMATHSSIHAWKIQWTEEPGGATAHGVAKSRTQLSEKEIAREHFMQRLAQTLWT